jgi:drug/metabolite transporter (DMT)-like permease
LPAQLPKQNTLHGILLVLAAVFLFACQDTIGKYLFQLYPVPFVQAARYGVNLALTLLIFMPRLGKSFMLSKRWPLASVRGLTLALGSLTGGLALRTIPLAEMNSILYLGPLFLLFLAQPLLGERVKWFSWIATAIGFVGLLFIARPGSGLNSTGLIFAFLCLITAVVYPLLSRILSKTESMPTLLFYVGLTGTVYYFAQLPWTIPQVLPTWPHVGLMLALGTVSLISHGLFTMAYARATVSLLAPFTYAHIAWATVLGWLVFNQVPDHITFIGMGLIAVAGVGNAVMNHRNSRRVLVDPEPLEI